MAKLNPRNVRFGLRDCDLAWPWDIYNILDEIWGFYHVTGVAAASPKAMSWTMYNSWKFCAHLMWVLTYDTGWLFLFPHLSEIWISFVNLEM
jgi:hypothetical protein